MALPCSACRKFEQLHLCALQAPKKMHLADHMAQRGQALDDMSPLASAELPATPPSEAAVADEGNTPRRPVIACRRHEGTATSPPQQSPSLLCSSGPASGGGDGLDSNRNSGSIRGLPAGRAQSGGGRGHGGRGGGRGRGRGRGGGRGGGRGRGAFKISHVRGQGRGRGRGTAPTLTAHVGSHMRSCASGDLTNVDPPEAPDPPAAGTVAAAPLDSIAAQEAAQGSFAPSHGGDTCHHRTRHYTSSAAVPQQTAGSSKLDTKLDEGTDLRSSCRGGSVRGPVGGRESGRGGRGRGRGRGKRSIPGIRRTQTRGHGRASGGGVSHSRGHNDNQSGACEGGGLANADAALVAERPTAAAIAAAAPLEAVAAQETVASSHDGLLAGHIGSPARYTKFVHYSILCIIPFCVCRWNDIPRPT